MWEGSDCLRTARKALERKRRDFDDNPDVIIELKENLEDTINL